MLRAAWARRPPPRRGGSRRPLSSRAPAGVAKLYDGLWANTTFEALGIHAVLAQALASQGILRPTLIQAEAFRPLARGRDAVLRAETGSGKTLAYLLPLVNRVYHLHDRVKQAARTDANAPNPLQSNRPWVVLAPTSDLCAQILAMLEAIDCDRLVAAQSLQRLFKWEAFSSRESSGFQSPRPKEFTALPSPSSMGGLPHSPRAATPLYAAASPRIRWGAVDLVVSTPFKFWEDLMHFKDDELFPACVVMDEADALFHGPSRTHLFDIFAAMRPRLKIRQPDQPRTRLPDLVPTQFVFSAATMLHIGPFSAGNMIIERFCTAQIVETPHFHRLPTGIGLESVRWLAASSDWDRRVGHLMEVLRNVPCERTLIFVNSLHNGHVLLKFFREKGWPVVSFMKGPRGGMVPRFQDARRFAEGDKSFMISTEFGGRGIDWPVVDHIVNFQMPTSAVSWLHRAGRTGRMGRQGLVTNFVGVKDRALSDLIKARLHAGKDLHGVFSRKRSLPRRLRAERGEGGEGGDSSGTGQAEDGVYHLQGGLELFEEGLLGGGGGARSGCDEDGAGDGGEAAIDGGGLAAGSEGTLIGYLPAIERDQEPGVVSRRPRRQAKGTYRNIENGADDGASDGDDAMAAYRKELLASDSDEDSEGSSGSSSRDEDDGQVQALPQEAAAFSWSMLDETSAGAVVAPPSRRQLLNRGGERDERNDRRRRRPGRGAGSRRGLGVEAVSRVRAGRNYAEPEDELLL